MHLTSYGLVVSCATFVRLQGQESLQQFALLQCGHSRDILRTVLNCFNSIMGMVGMGIIQAISKASNLVLLCAVVFTLFCLHPIGLLRL